MRARRQIKKTECQRIDAFKLWCWRLLKVLWTARRSNQSILREINPQYSLEGLMLKLKLQYFGHLMWTDESLKSPWCRERLRDETAGRHHWCNEHELGQTGRWWGTGGWRAAVHGVSKNWTQLGDWKTTATIVRPGKDGPPLSWLLVYVQGLADSKVSVNNCWMGGY